MNTSRQFSLALEALDSLKLGTNSNETDRGQPVPAAPSLDQVLSETGPLPREALFLGIASDGLPVLLNLHDPHPGPMLVIGEAGAGKTAFLQSIARSRFLLIRKEICSMELCHTTWRNGRICRGPIIAWASSM